MGLAWLVGVLAVVAAACGPSLPEGLVARVSGEDLTVEDFKAQAGFMGLGGDPRALTPELRQAVVETMVNQRLVEAEARSLGVELSEEELAREESLLRQGMTSNAFERGLASQGLTYGQWRAVLRRDVLVRKTLDLVLTPKVGASVSEVEEYYQAHPDEFQLPEQVLAQHVVLPTREMADQLLQRVAAGDNLAHAAASLGVAQLDEGRPAWLNRGHMPEELEKKIFELKPGKLAGPWASAYGFHVIRVLEKRPAGKSSLAAATESIQRRLSADKMVFLAEAWLEELRNSRQISFNQDFLAHGR